MQHANEQIAEEWERRSKTLGATLRSVLFKRLPEVANEHLHNWHKKVVLDQIEEKEGLRILDAGCGYGRLSIPIIEKFPDVDIKGMDVSENYVRLYRENTNRFAICGAIEDMPDTLGTFDYIICITVLMYLDDQRLKRAISKLLFHLKTRGELILIEPHCSGIPFQTGFGMLTCLRNMAKRHANDIRGRCFSSEEIRTYFYNSGGKIVWEHRLPVTSLFFLPFVLVGRLFPNNIAKRIYRIVSLFDTFFCRLKFPSIYAAYLIMKR